MPTFSNPFSTAALRGAALLSGLLCALVPGPARAAVSPASYSAGFQVGGIGGGLHALATGHAVFDGDRSFPGRWAAPDGSIDHGIPHARTLTTDLAAVVHGPDGSPVPVWGTQSHSANRDRGGQGPLAFGTSFAFACGSPGHGCATGSHTASSASVFGGNLFARVDLTDRHAEAHTEASWSRGFLLDPHASFTFGGFATAAIDGDPVPLALGSRFTEHHDPGSAVSSMSFGDVLGRARTTLGASLWGDNALFGHVAYALGEGGLLSVTVTNRSDTVLTGRLEAGAHVDLSAPIPEPETWLMLLAGAGLVGGVARRRGGRAPHRAVGAPPDLAGPPGREGQPPVA